MILLIITKIICNHDNDNKDMIHNIANNDDNDMLQNSAKNVIW